LLIFGPGDETSKEENIMAKIEKKRVSILGCGWLGLPLAQRLRQAHTTFEIKGSTTSALKMGLLADAGITPYQFALSPDFTCGSAEIKSFLDTDVLIISVPPKMAKNGQDFHVQQIEALVRELAHAQVREIIYISSTSVYPEPNGIVIEQDVIVPAQSAAPAMVKAENLLLELRPEKTVCILRLGGLLGYNRIPGKYVRGMKDMTTGTIPVNYIHRDDAVGVITRILDDTLLNETFNVVAPLHPTRREVYQTCCDQFGWEPPTFLEQENKPDFKIISADKLTGVYDYPFQYPDPIAFYYETDE
jgi:nucleoside-diphosphate-sugar epimerase